MNNLEDRLRHDLKTLAQQAQPTTIRPLRLPAPGRRPRATRWLAPIAAMAAVATLISVVTIVGNSVSHRPGPAEASTGMPPYYVALHEAARNHLMVIGVTVRSSLSGAVLTSLTIPTGWRAPLGETVPTTITAAADDRTFAIGTYMLGKPLGKITPIISTVYLLQVTADGRSVRLRPLSLKPAPGLYAPSLSPDGRQLAIHTVECRPNNPTCSGALEIISLPSGSVSRVWLVPDTASLDDVPVQWVDGGRGLLFNLAFQATPWLAGYRLLNVGSPSGSLIAHARRIGRPPAANRDFSNPPTLLTPDGQGFISTEYSARGPLGRRLVTMKLVEFSARTGHILRVFRTVTRVLPKGDDNICGVISMASDGLHVLVRCPGFGRLDDRRFTPLPGVPSTLAPGELSAGDNAAW